jgi:serine protease Do
MKYIIIAFISFFLIGCKEVSTTDIVNQKINGVVLISNDVTETQGGIGTGFIIGNKIVTNLHVVEGNGKITVYSGNSDRKYEAIVAFQDPVADIAVLTLKDWDAFKKNEKPVGLEFGDSEETNVGDRVVVIGHPWGLLWSVSEGIISAKDRRVNQNPKFLDQTDAKLYQGNSGGPVFNEEGQVVCISNMMLSQEGGSYGFCIPSNLAKKVLYDFEKFGEVRWRVLNVLTELTDNGSTLILKTIEPNGAAANAGLKEGDKILEVYTPNNHPNGLVIKSSDDLITELAILKGDDEIIKLLIDRNGEKLVIDVKTNHKLSKDYPAS